MVERIRSLLARFPEDEERRLVATDARFDALCDEHRKVVELLDGLEVEVKGAQRAEGFAGRRTGPLAGHARMARIAG